uniref:THAP-type domain-containing protein n=1 Tax=Acrobeloides nanus TaxID=290746 RepID=A0A914EC38_9BILA
MFLKCLWCNKEVEKKIVVQQLNGVPPERPVYFPENEYIRKQWLHSMRMDINTKIEDSIHFLCKEHFNIKDRFDIHGHTLIRYGAMPTNSLMCDDDGQQNNKKRRLSFLTGEYSDELVPKMGWKHIPYELIYEMLSFHTRNEIEKFQLVSKTWNQIVIGGKSRAGTSMTWQN